MRALSLEYHDVVEGGDFDASGFPGPGAASYKLTRTEFNLHLDAIARAVRRSPTHALEWHGWRGHFLVTAQRVGSPSFMSAAQIRELHARGHVIGTHSYSHPTRMGACAPERILDEWQRSVAILSDILGEPVVTGSVPGGYYTRPVAEAGARTG